MAVWTGPAGNSCFLTCRRGLYQGLLRIDPGYFGGILIDELKIVVTLHGGRTPSPTAWMMLPATDGASMGPGRLFRMIPQIYFQIPGGQSAQTIQVSYTGPAYMSAVEAKCIEEAFACTSAQLSVEAEGKQRAGSCKNGLFRESGRMHL